MKILFFLLVTANVALFMWEFKQGAFTHAEKPIHSTQSTGLESIVLVSELNNGQANHQTPTAPQPLSDAPKLAQSPIQTSPNCYLAGPFSNPSQFKYWTRQLGPIASEVKPITKNDQIVNAYIVYYPAAETLEKSKENLQGLKNQGLNDAWLFTQGEQPGEIALGTFSREDRAIQMKSELLAKGVSAEIKPKYKSRTQQYAEFKADQTLLEKLAEPNVKYPNLEIKAIGQCSDPEPKTEAAR